MINETTEKLVAMFTENTGKNLLDSGGAYGRAWERNQGKTAADFMAAPYVEIDAQYQMISLNMFQYLNERLTYDAALDAYWNKYDELNSDGYWTDNLEEWLDTLGVPEEGEFYSAGRWWFNSYNCDNLLDGTYQGLFFGLGDKQYVALQIHGGCDVRGGYTKPVIFECDKESMALDMSSASLCCPNCEFRAFVNDGQLQEVDMPTIAADENALLVIDSETKLPREWQIWDGCPIDHAQLIG